MSAKVQREKKSKSKTSSPFCDDVEIKRNNKKNGFLSLINYSFINRDTYS